MLPWARRKASITCRTTRQQRCRVEGLPPVVPCPFNGTDSTLQTTLWAATIVCAASALSWPSKCTDAQLRLNPP